MDDFFDLDPAQQTFQKLLCVLMDFGPRFRLRYRGKEWTPLTLLLDLVGRNSTLLPQVCQIQPTVNPDLDWRVKTRSPDGSLIEPLCQIVDLLAFHRVVAFLEGHLDPGQFLVLRATDRQSSFLSAYYRATLGHVPPQVEKDRLPLWLAMLEELFAGLLVNQREVEASFATIHSWMGAIAGFSHASRARDKALDDGEVDWEPAPGLEREMMHAGSVR